jgi:uncharacterized protein YyaL (SSP411 family)
VIEETIGFVERELMHKEGCFYSALDADSEGVEGKFYIWSKQEIEQILGGEAELFCMAYNISDKGNWEHTNILWLPAGLTPFAEKLAIKEDIFEQRLAACKAKLFEAREKRIRPQLDDKALLGWNALMITAICKAASATANHDYKALAERSVAFIEKHFKTPQGVWLHTWKNGEAKYHAFLDDLAAMIQAYLQLATVTGNVRFLHNAKTLALYVMENFSDEEGRLFYFTGLQQEDVIVRKKEVYDGAVPSGNALMAENLFLLSVYLIYLNGKNDLY